MLVLSRKCNEGIVICEPGELQCDCRIRVLSIRGSRVRLGIEADPQTTVRRAEVVVRIRPEGHFGDSA
jgi:carbon storage regulator CsrA